MEELSREEIIAMAVACIAQETGTEAKDLRVTSFREVQLSPLAQYVSDNGVNYKKYTLEDELV